MAIFLEVYLKMKIHIQDVSIVNDSSLKNFDASNNNDYVSPCRFFMTASYSSLFTLFLLNLLTSL